MVGYVESTGEGTNATATAEKGVKMKKVALLDYCVPCYFGGYQRTVIAVPVFGMMTHKEVAEEIKREVDALHEMIDPGDMPLYDEFVEEMAEKGDEVYVEQEELDEDVEPAYLYFSVINPVTRHGITFLNP